MPSPSSRFRSALLAAGIAVAVLSAACSPDSSDAIAGPDEEPATTLLTPSPPSTAPAEPDSNEAPDPGADAADGAEAPDDDGNIAVPIAQPVDLGVFDDYEPAEPDPTLLGVDSAVRIGTLDNGFTYYLRSNDSPAAHVSMRLVVNVGALSDPPGREGIAHYLKHMLFRGTESFPGDELTDALRVIGTQTDPDDAANTAADETVYRLDFALDDPEALDTAFAVASQWASAAVIDAEAVEAERAIVVDEYRRRDEAANGWIGNFLDAIYYSGTVYDGMLLVGSEESNSSITAAELRDFYEIWYRPDNMALVVVGDVAVAGMEQRVEQFFGGLANPAEPMPAQPERHAFTANFADEPVVDVAAHPDYGSISMSIDWQLPAWTPSTVGGDRLRWMEAVISYVLEVRLADAHRAGLMAQAGEPYIRLWQQTRGLRLYGTNIKGRDLQQATTDYLSVLAGAAHHGIEPDELEQAAATARTWLESQLEREATIENAGYASRYVLNYTRGESIESVEDRVDRLTALLDSFTVEELTAHLRWILDNAPPLVVSLGDNPANVPDAAQLRSAIDAVVPVPPPAAEEPIETLLAAPDPVAPIRDHPVSLFEGAHEWVFANGARVVFAPSALAAGQVNVTAQSLGGWSQLPKGAAAMRRSITRAVANSGVADYSASQLDEYLAGTTAQVTPNITELTEGFTGSASPDDLDDLLALMHLYITEPRISDVAAAEHIYDLEIRRGYFENNPLWTAYFTMYDAFYQHSPWYHFILTAEEIDAVTAEGLLEMYEARLGDVDDLMVVIVGDTDRAAVAELAARYIGTLPAGAPDQHVIHNPGLPPGVQRITIPVDAESGATGLRVQFGAAVPVTAETMVIADLIETLLDDRLSGTVRDDLGQTYTTSTVLSPDIEIGHYWHNDLSATGPSESLEQINATILAAIARLTAEGPTDAELAQAKSALHDDYQLDDNDEITQPLLRRRYLDDALVGTPQQRLTLLDEIDAADIARYLPLFLNLDNRIEVFRTAE